MTVNDAIIRIDSVDMIAERLRSGMSVDPIVIADHLEEYAEILRGLEVNVNI